VENSSLLIRKILLRRFSIPIWPDRTTFQVVLSLHSQVSFESELSFLKN